MPLKKKKETKTQDQRTLQLDVYLNGSHHWHLLALGKLRQEYWCKSWGQSKLCRHISKHPHTSRMAPVVFKSNKDHVNKTQIHSSKSDENVIAWLLLPCFS